MKKVVRLGKDTVKTVVTFESYKLTSEQNACPECGRPFKEYDVKRLADNGAISCPKCGAKLSR